MSPKTMPTIAIRREVLASEQRAPLTPSHCPQLLDQEFKVVVGPCRQRVFEDDEYSGQGAAISTELGDSDLILGLKELPADRLMEGKVHAFFSHTIKGQPKNMPMLQHLMERSCTLIDYERITDASGRRLVFFGRYAGLAGMIDTLWALGQRLAFEGIATPLAGLKSAYEYSSLEQALSEVREAGEKLQHHPMPERLTPLVIGVAGEGNVSKGAQEVLDALGVRAMRPSELADLPHKPGIYKVVFSERHMVEPRLGIFDPAMFDVQHYYDNPGRYRGVFERYLPYLNVMVNCIYWDNHYPRLITLEGLRQLYDGSNRPRLEVIGDISCDIRGAVEATVRTTKPTNPVFVYEVDTGAAKVGVEGRGPVILAVYNLPSEFPREASQAFGDTLLPFVPAMALNDYDQPFDRCSLPDELKRATIVYRGELTPAYRYLEDYL